MQTSIVNIKVKYDDLVNLADNIFNVFEEVPEEDKSEFIITFFKRICVDYFKIKMVESKHSFIYDSLPTLEEILKYIKDEKYSLFFEIIGLISSELNDINISFHEAKQIDNAVKELDDLLPRTRICESIIANIELLSSRMDMFESRINYIEKQ